jgi:hypothetical protein
MQCIGQTKAGSQCKRKALEGEAVCTAHFPAIPEAKPTPDTVLTDEQVEAAQASAARANESREEETAKGVGVLRKKGTGPGSGGELRESDIPYPTEVHGDDFEHYGPQGMGATIPKDVEIAAYSGDQEFMIVPKMVRNLMFQKPGRNLPKKRLYTIKAIHKDGRLSQLGFEQQIQNNAGGDPEDAIGLRRYQRKGIHLLISFETLIPVYCAAWDCWAEAASDGAYVGFCAMRHAKHTLPNQYKNAGAIVSGIFGDNATTSRTWEA